jgi:hypothetical protein
VCLIAVTAALAQNQGPPTAAAGSWEGNLEGVKAVTVNLRGPDSQPEGSVVFYILKDEGSGFQNGPATPAIPMQDLRRVGDLLRFRVRGSNGAALSFEMRITGASYARLTRLRSGSIPELTVALRRQSEK